MGTRKTERQDSLHLKLKQYPFGGNFHSQPKEQSVRKGPRKLSWTELTGDPAYRQVLVGTFTNLSHYNMNTFLICLMYPVPSVRSSLVFLRVLVCFVFHVLSKAKNRPYNPWQNPGNPRFNPSNPRLKTKGRIEIQPRVKIQYPMKNR